MSQTLVRWQDLMAVPWKNGGGVLRRVASAPTGLGAASSGDSDWSVSIAEIEADGPFSTFPGIDRILMLIGGTELTLTIDGTPHRLRHQETLAFPGDAPTTCRLPAGPARALNLMTRRGHATGASHAVVVAGKHVAKIGDGQALVLVALTEGLVAGDGVRMDALDAIVEDGPGIMTVTGNGTVAEIRIDR